MQKRILKRWLGEFCDVTVWTRTGCTVFVDVELVADGRRVARHRFHDLQPHHAARRGESDGASEFRTNEEFYRVNQPRASK